MELGGGIVNIQIITLSTLFLGGEETGSLVLSVA